jgi:5-formyltetrahydrofolate cyclo-ligase
MSLPEAPASNDWDAVRAWRKAMREHLIARRVALSADVRRARGEEAQRRLAAGIDLTRYGTLGIYWPIRGEINVRELARRHLQSGGRVGLPVIVARSAPVEFWSWQPGARMRRGIWDIPVPAEREVVVPDALIIPLVGFDGSGYRLGYGAGYYDRTIAAASPRPYCIGLGHEEARLPTIHPQPHDIPMDVIATEQALLEFRSRC